MRGTEDEARASNSELMCRVAVGSCNEVDMFLVKSIYPSFGRRRLVPGLWPIRSLVYRCSESRLFYFIFLVHASSHYC